MQCLIESYEHCFKIFREERERCEQHWIGNYIEEAGILEGFLELGRWCKMEHPQRERRKEMRVIPEKALRFLVFFKNRMVPQLVPSPRETDMRVRGLLCNNDLIWIRHRCRKRRLKRSTLLPPPPLLRAGILYTGWARPLWTSDLASLGIMCAVT